MFRVREPPQHVGIEIQAGEIEEENSALELRKLRIEDPAMFSKHSLRLLEILLVIEHAIGPGLRVLGDALPMELAGFLREHSRIFRTSSNQQSRICRINVHGHTVQPKTR